MSDDTNEKLYAALADLQRLLQGRDGERILSSCSSLMALLKTTEPVQPPDGKAAGSGGPAKDGVESFVDDLLAGRIFDVYLIRECMDSFRWNIRGKMRILSVRPDAGASPGAAQGALRQIERCFPDMTVFMYGAYVKTVLLLDTETMRKQDAMRAFEALLEKQDLFAGLSRVFSDIREFAERSEESDKALELGCIFDPSLRLYDYDDYSIYHMLEVCQPHTKVMKFCHTSIIKLAEYDRAHSHELVDTLKYYLFHNRSATKAAAHLHLHRNTMNYRIEKIRELLDIDIDDSRTSFMLMLSFYILDYCGATVMRGIPEKLE
jgi:hypothetical protein